MLLRPLTPQDTDSIVAIWNAASGPSLATTRRLVEYNLRPATGALQAGQIAMQDKLPVGFVLASVLPNDPRTSSPQVGWVDAIVVSPLVQNQGIGSALLDWAEQWLRSQGCARTRLGASLRPFVPGYPSELGDAAFFKSRGYSERPSDGEIWDLARDLSEYKSKSDPRVQSPRSSESFPATKQPINDNMLIVRPALPEDEPALIEFFNREFPNRWRFEFAESRRENGRISDYILLVTERGLDGFARLTLDDSERPIDRFYMHALPHPWGQLGPIGVSKDRRGYGLGSALLDACLCHLQDQRVRGCVIDWTGLPQFYEKFGFKPYRKYLMLLKIL